jgi:hypothetical protein
MYGMAVLVEEIIGVAENDTTMSWLWSIIFYVWHIMYFSLVDGIAYWLTQESAGRATMTKVWRRIMVWAIFRGLLWSIFAGYFLWGSC